MSPDPLLNTGGLIFMSAYLFSLIGIGLAGRLARKENTLDRIRPGYAAHTTQCFIDDHDQR